MSKQVKLLAKCKVTFECGGTVAVGWSINGDIPWLRARADSSRVVTHDSLCAAVTSSFAVASFTVTTVSLSTGVRSGDFSVTLARLNPNTKVAVRFDTIVATVYHGGTVVAEAAMPAMYQLTLAERTVTNRFVAATTPLVGSDPVRGARRDMSSGRGDDDVLWFRVEAACRLAFHQVNGAEAARWRKVMVLCNDVPVQFDNMTVPLTSGKLVGPLRPCTIE